MKTLFFTKSPYLFLFLSIITLLTIIFTKSYKPLVIYAIIIIFLIYFYRVPNRDCQSKELDITSPSDGTIKDIVINPDGTKIISIFLSPFDVHVQYIPYNGVVIDKKYKEGKFHPAYLLQKSALNEQSIISVRTKYGDLSVKQIAGLVARRIITEPKIGDHVKKGSIYGMIKLSSRVDLTVPKNSIVHVKKGDHVKGCQSILARFIDT